jgi:predicted Zn-dependent protease with MMP-like domain
MHIAHPSLAKKAPDQNPSRGTYTTMDRRIFERLVTEALNGLPEFFREKLDNVAVVVEDWPDLETLRAAEVRHPAGLLGLYRGVPQTKRTHNYGLVLPDKISIYQRPIEMRCRTVEQVRATIGQVLRHELAHHFGIGDERLRQLGARQRHKSSETPSGQ